MHFLLSVSDAEQYEKNLCGFILPFKMPKSQFYALLNLLGPCLEDHPHYHFQFLNDDHRYIYICFDIVGK